MNSGAKVLIVEDEQLIAVQMKSSLQKRGYEVFSIAGNGEEAIKKIETDIPDIVLMDIALQGDVNGIDTAIKIINNYDVPVIFITAYSDEATLQNASIAGAYAFILKPVDEIDLYAAVKTTISKHAMEKKLKESEEKYRLLFENIQDLVVRFDTEGIINLVSPSASRITGYPVNELNGYHISILLEDSAEYLTFLNKVLEAGFVEGYEIVISAKSGSKILMSANAHYYSDLRGKSAGIEGIFRNITDRKRNEVLLAQEKNKLFKILDMLPAFVYLVSKDQRIHFVNNKFHELFGSIEESRQDTLFYIGDNSNAESPTFDVFKTKNPKTWEWKDKRDRDYIISDNLIEFEDGEEMVLGIGVDVSERKLIEKALKESDERFRQAMDATNEGIWDWDIVTGSIYCSPSYYRMLGYETAEFQNGDSAWENIMHPDDREYVIKVYNDCIENLENSFEIEFRVMTKTGEWKWILSRGKVVKRQSSGKALRILGTHVDITERKNADQALRKSEEKFRQLVLNLNEGIWVADKNANTSFVNPRMAQVLGYSEEEMMGRHLFAFMDADGVEECKKYLDRRLQGIKENHDFKFIRKDGSYMYAHLEAAPVYDDSGSYNGLIAGVMDITERKQYEVEIKRLTQELLMSQEKERQRVARDLHDGVGQTIIAAKLFFNAYRNDPEKYIEQFNMGLQFIDKASQDLREVCSDLYPSILKDLGLEATIRWYAKNYLQLNGFISNLELTLSKKLPYNVEVHLYRIIQEIFSNIVKYSKADSVTVELFQNSSDKNIMLVVTDNGIGFTADKFGGKIKGSGLINIRHRTEIMGGDLVVKSVKNNGTKIIVRIPELE